jgi:hypothetical protein
MQSAIPLHIEQDWSEVFGAFDDVWQDRERYGLVKRQEHIHCYEIRRRDGNVLVWKDPSLFCWSKEQLAAEYDVSDYNFMFAHWSGPDFERLIPWHDNLLDFLKPLNPDRVKLQIFTGRLPRHIDGGGPDRRNPNECNILHVIDCQDPTAATFSQSITDKKDVRSIQSQPGLSFLLDTSQWHWVRNIGLRITLRLSLSVSYEEAKAWWDQQQPLQLRHVLSKNN